MTSLGVDLHDEKAALGEAADDTDASLSSLEFLLPPFLAYERTAHSTLEGHYSDGGTSSSPRSSLSEKEAFDLHSSDSEALRVGRKPRRYTLNHHVWLVPIVALILLLLILSLFHVGHHTAFASNTFTERLKEIKMDHVFDGTFAIERKTLHWLSEAGDGIYAVRDKNLSITLHNLADNSQRLLVSGFHMRTSTGKQIQWNDFEISADMRYVLVDTLRSKVWRHSYKASYYVHDLNTAVTTPLVPADEQHGSVLLATWAPEGHAIAYVHSNDLFVLSTPTSSPIRLTQSGSASIINGAPDWVYEEEVFQSNRALWWNNKGDKLAWLTFNDSLVPNYEYPVYNPDPRIPGLETAYPVEHEIPYPKPAYPNPSVSLSVFDLGTYLEYPTRPNLMPNVSDIDDARLAAASFRLAFPDGLIEPIVSEVVWVDSAILLVKQTDRSATRVRTVYFDLAHLDLASSTVSGRIVQDKDYLQIDQGWVEPTQLIKTNISKSHPTAYLDIQPDQDGYNHIALFTDASSRVEPQFLTNGKWEVSGGISCVDGSRGLIWYVAALPSMERHLFSIPLPALDQDLVYIAQPTKHTFNSTTYVSVRFSPQCRFYLYNAEGPDVPWQALVDVDKKRPVQSVTDNKNLKSRLSTLKQPLRVTYEIDVNGTAMNVVEFRPASFDSSGRTRYPVLFRPYGGPSSQTADSRFMLGWSAYLASTLKVIVVSVDGRGTGYKGRRFRIPVRGKLGQLEAEDQIDAARHFAGQPYVNEDKIGIFGWSYGGYLASKVIEANSSVFNLGIAIAPVIDWRFYDSVYTERYMGLYVENTDGYATSAVTKMDGFKHAHFFLASGSGDDNVHLVNTMTLLDRLTAAKARGFRFRLFTDSDHSITTRGANRELFEEVTAFIEHTWFSQSKVDPFE